MPSIFHDIEPIGLRTRDVESLSSYLIRHAQSLGVLPAQLVYRLMVWHAAKAPHMTGTWPRRSGRIRLGFSPNSFAHATVVLRSISGLTGRGDLDLLTTTSWDHLFPTRGFQRSSMAYCRTCLATDKIPYHRLTWSLRAFTTCLEHRERLQEHCLQCGHNIAAFHDRSTIVCCPRCSADLLHVGKRDLLGPTSFDVWSSNEIARIIEASSNWTRPLTWEPALAIRHAATALSLDNPASLARYLGRSRLTTWYWITGKAAPSLPSALAIFYRLGRSLAEQLGAKPVRTRYSWENQTEIHLSSRNPAVHRQWDAVEATLRLEMSRSRDQARPLVHVARDLNTPVRTLRAHFPDLCRAIAGLNRERKTAAIRSKRQVLAKRLAAAVESLRTDGIPVTRKEVARRINQPTVFNHVHAREILSRFAPEA